jgi:hypothetical protein
LLRGRVAGCGFADFYSSQLLYGAGSHRSENMQII